jgi:hypothetical protein
MKVRAICIAALPRLRERYARIQTPAISMNMPASKAADPRRLPAPFTMFVAHA